MIPSRIFRSRWSALVWAAGVLWTVYDVATGTAPAGNQSGVTAPRDAIGEAVDSADLAILANAGS